MIIAKYKNKMQLVSLSHSLAIIVLPRLGEIILTSVF